MEPRKQDPRGLFAQPIRYEIPAFQRRYVWKQDEQWEPLWDDVEKLAQAIVDGDREVHFMGAIVLQSLQSPTTAIRRCTVVDGQQRLVTLQLLIGAIQEVLEDREHAGPADILASLLANDERRTDGKADRAFKVWPTVVDREAFRHAMNKDLSAMDYAESSVVQAHEYFKRKAGGWLDSSFQTSQERDKAASALANALDTGLEIVIIELEQSDDAPIIFETLNARGTPLLQSDMVKNKILHDAGILLSDDEASQAEKRVWPFAEDWWAEEVGTGLQRRPRIDVYLNHWLTLRKRMETKPYDEFREFEEYAGKRPGKGTIQNIAEDMGELGSTYREVEQLRRKDIQRFIERRNAMGVGVITPLLLWLLDAKLPPDKLANCLKALESFLVRRIVCRYSARSYGSLFVALIAKLAEDSPKNADRVIVSHLGEQKAQAALWPGDQELRNSFLNDPLYKYLTRARLRLVLEGIEEKVRTNKTESGEVPGTLHIEHVMPQAWHANWPLLEGVDDYEAARAKREQVIHTIGNLTLVNGPLNADLSNASWETKREALARHSVPFLNKQLVNDGPDVWDESGIAERGQWLYESAVKIWPHSSDFGFRAGCEAEQIEEGERDLRNGRTVAADRRMRALDRALACGHPTGNIDRMLADIERGRDLH